LTVERLKGNAVAKSKVAKSRIVDAVADAVVRAEIAVVRTGRKAVAAINKRTRKKTAVRKAVSKAKRAVRRVTKKAARRVRRR
jgi:hypothetical protein